MLIDRRAWDNVLSCAAAPAAFRTNFLRALKFPTPPSGVDLCARFHPTLNLRRDTTSDQLQQVLASFREILTRHAKVETGKMPVRFIGVGPYSLDVEADAYVTTADYDEFMALRQELLIGNAESSRTCRYRTCCTDAGELRSQQCSADVAVRCALQPKNPRSGVGNFARLGNTVGMSALVTPNHRASVAPY
jgi:hypothetical protein